MFQFNRNKYNNYSDEELVELFQDKGLKLCISLLYERYGHLVMGVGLKYLKNPTDAEDLTMQIFESLFVKLKNHSIKQFKPWLYMVVKNECLMLLRKKKKNIPVELTDNLTNTDTESDIILKELQLSKLEMAIEELKPEQKQCVSLFYLQQKSYSEISLELMISEKQVKSAIQNGKRNLKILLEKEHEFRKEQ